MIFNRTLIKRMSRKAIFFTIKKNRKFENLNLFLFEIFYFNDTILACTWQVLYNFSGWYFLWSVSFLFNYVNITVYVACFKSLERFCNILKKRSLKMSFY